jgi:hypothetical protein
MKKILAISLSLIMITVGVSMVPQQTQAEKPGENFDGIYYTYFDKCDVIDDPPSSKVWCEPKMADMVFKTFQSTAKCIGFTQTLKEGKLIACQLHLSGLAYGFYNNVDITYKWEGGMEHKVITLPHNELYSTTINFIEEDSSSYQLIEIKVFSGGFCSAQVAADLNWFYVGNERPYEFTTPPYYLNFNESKWDFSGNAKACTNNDYADMALFTGEPDGKASAIGTTNTWYEDSNCKCPYVGVKVHITGYVKGRGWAILGACYGWDEHAVKKEWAFFGGPGEGNLIDEVWIFTDYYYLSKIQSLRADLSVGSAIEANLFIDVEWFYEGCGPPNPPTI